MPLRPDRPAAAVAGAADRRPRAARMPRPAPRRGPCPQPIRALGAAAQAGTPPSAPATTPAAAQAAGRAWPPQLPRMRDYVLYLAGESEFFAGRPARARTLFEELERQTQLAAAAAGRATGWPTACGPRATAPAAVAAYRKLLGASAEGERRASGCRARARTPAAAVGNVGARRGGGALPGGAGAGRAAARASPIRRRERARGLPRPARRVPRPPAGRARRAPGRARWRRAPATGGRQPPATGRHARGAPAPGRDAGRGAPASTRPSPSWRSCRPACPRPLAAERDFLLGMTMYKMRQDYARRREAAAGGGRSLTGEKAASAAFHGTRALSRVHRDDEAIVGYRQVASSASAARAARPRRSSCRAGSS